MQELDFVSNWYFVMKLLAISFCGIGIIDFIFYHIKVASTSDLKKKFDLITSLEIKRYKRVVVWMAIAVFFGVNLYANSTVKGVGMA